VSEGKLAILTLNVASPSVERAERQLEWLGKRDEGVFVLTETSRRGGSELLAERLRGAGWAVRAPVPREGERGVMVCARVRLDAQPPPLVEYLPERVERVAVDGIEVIGVYAPSRDQSPEKVARKRRFLAELLTTVGADEGAQRVVIGDLNIVERSDRSGGFAEWEYEQYDELPRLGWSDAYRTLHPERAELSWVDDEGRGHRFDHTFISSELGERLARCEYVHETREENLSDHSAMVVEIEGVASETLEVDSSLAGGPPSLF
jgi:exodeoxyribonuclease-3